MKKRLKYLSASLVNTQMMIQIKLNMTITLVKHARLIGFVSGAKKDATKIMNLFLFKWLIDLHGIAVSV